MTFNINLDNLGNHIVDFDYLFNTYIKKNDLTISLAIKEYIYDENGLHLHHLILKDKLNLSRKVDIISLLEHYENLSINKIYREISKNQI